MIIDRNKRIGGAARKIVVGLPYTRAICTGTIDGTNKAFKTPYGPIYPANHLGPLPLPADMVMETIKGTTYTPVTVEELDTSLDPILNAQVYDTINLLAAPLVAGADNVLASGYEEVWCRITEDITPDIKQKSEEIEECGTDDVITIYGSKTRKYKAQLKVALGTLELLRKIHRKPKSDQTGVPEGYVLYTERDVPIPIKAYIPTVYDDEEISREYLSDVTVDPDSIAISVKAGDTAASVTLNLNIASAIEELVPEDA